MSGLRRLKLYSDQDSDFKLYSRFKDVVFPEDEIVVSVLDGHLCITSIATKPNPRGKFLTDQFEMPLPYLGWFLGVKTRFELSPDLGGYPADEMSDLARLDSDNEVFVFRGSNFANRGLMMFSLENRLRTSYLLESENQEFDLYDKYFDQCGLLDTFLKIQRDYEDGVI